MPAGAVPAFLPLTPHGLHRCFLVVVPAAEVLALRDRRVAALGCLGSGAAVARILQSLLAETCERAAQGAVAGLLHELRLPVAGPPRVVAMAAPPAGDLILRVEVPAFPEVEPPDPATLGIERVVVPPDPDAVPRALASLAARRGIWADRPPGTRAEPGDRVVCDVDAVLLPAVNRIPQPGIAGASPGAPGRLPEGWSFGDNGAGLAIEVLAARPEDDVPHVRMRVHGAAARDGQSFVIFHPPRSIAATPGSAWVGSVAVRPVGQPAGLRGAKLRLHSQAASAEGALRRKDSALLLETDGFVRCYVSDKLPEAETAFLRMPLLFDHAAGTVDFTLDIGAPRLVEGLDLGEAGPAALPQLAGHGLRLGGGSADPAGLAAHLPGLAAGETREVVIRMPDGFADRALAGRSAQVTLRATAVLCRVVPPADDALARALGFAGLAALRDAVAAQLDADRAALARKGERRAALDALLAAAGDIPLPEEAIQAEFASLWPSFFANAEHRGEAPRQEAAMALAARRLRLGLLVTALARRHGLVEAGAAVEPRALEDAVVGFLLARARRVDAIPREA